jgi:Tfp pilus assembly protein PilO
MKRSIILLSSLAAILVLALFYVLSFQPQREELQDLAAQLAAEELVHADRQAELVRLRTVREEAPEVAAQLAGGEAIIPHDPSLPSALRQLQLAADESGVVLQAVTTARPVSVDMADVAGWATMDTNVQLLGSYYQIVDFLRRVEDPSITPRAVSWRTVAVSRDEYPQLAVTLGGQLHAVLEVPPPPPAPDGAVDDGEAPTGEDVEVDVEIDVDVEADSGEGTE